MRVKSSLRLFFVRLKSENKEKLKGKSKKEDFKEMKRTNDDGGL